MCKDDLKEGIKECKCRFDKTGDKADLINAAVLYGIYISSGGTVIMPLPPLVDSICNVTALLAKIRLKCREELTDSVFIKIRNQVQKFGVHIDYEDIHQITIIFKDTRVSVNVHSNVSELLASIGVVMLSNNDNWSKEQLRLIYEMQNKYFINIGRTYNECE